MKPVPELKPMTKDQCFSAFKSALKDRLGADIYLNYVEPMSVGAWDNDFVVLITNNQSAANLMTKEYGPQVHFEWTRNCGPVNHLEVAGAASPIYCQQRTPAISVVQDGLPDMSGVKGAIPLKAQHQAYLAESALPRLEEVERVFNPPLEAKNENSEAFSPDTDTEPPSYEGSGTLNPNMSMDRFCVNETNKMARMAIEQVIAGNGAPVTYIYGAMGRGKSHLLNAAALEWLRLKPTDKLMYLTYDSLVADVSDAFISNSVKELRTFLRDTDVLMFDDVQLLRGRKRTQEELACLIERLQQAGKPVVVAGALTPAQLAETGISQRLAERIAGGISVGINAPDLELRMKVAEAKAQAFHERTGLHIPRRHVELIARRCDASVRELEGMMRYIELAVESQADPSTPLSDDVVRRMLSEKLSGRRMETTLEDLFAFTAETFGLSKSELTSKSRKQPIVRARQAFALAARKLTDSPLTAIGAMIARDHTTVMHSVQKAEIIAETDTSFADKITRIFDEFDGS